MLAGLSRDGLPLTHWIRDKMAAILKCIFLNENVSISIQISLNCAPLGVQLTQFQRWFWWRLGADQATSHYMKQWWIVYCRIYASFGLNEFIMNLKATACHGHDKSSSYGNNKWLLCKTEVNIFVQWRVKTRSRKTPKLRVDFFRSYTFALLAGKRISGLIDSSWVADIKNAST